MRQTIRIKYPENLLCAIYGLTNFGEIKTDDDISVVSARMIEMLDNLSEREKGVLLCRFCKRMTQEKTGNVFGVGKERVRQIQNKALRKLRKPEYSEYILTGRNKKAELAELFEAKENKCKKAKLHEIGIEHLSFSVRTYNCLKRAGYNTVADIIVNEENLLRIRNAGTQTVQEIKAKIDPYRGMVQE